MEKGGAGDMESCAVIQGVQMLGCRGMMGGGQGLVLLLFCYGSLVEQRVAYDPIFVDTSSLTLQ